MGVRTFYKAVIGGLAFEGSVSVDGPYISCLSPDLLSHGGVALVVSRLRCFRPERLGGGPPKPHGWYVVKYDHEDRFFLPGFTAPDIEAMTAEFGLAVLGTPQHEAAVLFLRSRAWLALVEWVAKHPRLAQKAAEWDTYLPGWYTRAQAEVARVPALPLGGESMGSNQQTAARDRG